MEINSLPSVSLLISTLGYVWTKYKATGLLFIFCNWFYFSWIPVNVNLVINDLHEILIALYVHTVVVVCSYMRVLDDNSTFRQLQQEPKCHGDKFVLMIGFSY